MGLTGDFFIYMAAKTPIVPQELVQSPVLPHISKELVTFVNFFIRTGTEIDSKNQFFHQYWKKTTSSLMLILELIYNWAPILVPTSIDVA